MTISGGNPHECVLLASGLHSKSAMILRTGVDLSALKWQPAGGNRMAATLPSLAGLGGPGGQSAAQEAGSSGATARAKRYAHCGLEDMRAKRNRKRNRF